MPFLRYLIVGFALGLSTPVFANDADTDDHPLRVYKGELAINASASLPLVLNIQQSGDGLQATLDSPAQGANGIPVNDIAIDGEQLSFSSQVIQASFVGTKGEGIKDVEADDKESIENCYVGTFTQGADYPLTLCPAKDNNQPSAMEQLNKLRVDMAVFNYQQGQWSIDRNTFNVADDRQFEIGSVTKTMVAWLFAKALTDNIISPTAVVGDYWPNANDAVKNIALTAIATHHSGLSRLPTNLPVDDLTDPYADYSQDDLTEALANSSVKPSPAYEYSNFGFGLLAETVAKAYGESFDSLIQAKLFNPLAMSDSALALTSAVKDKSPKNLIKGQRIDGKTVSNWHFDALAGAGAVVSTVNDMTRYVQTMMQPSSDQESVVQALLEPRKKLSTNLHQAFGWLIEDVGEQQIIWHNGQTAGFTSFVGFTADGKRGVVILNAQARDVTGIGKQLLLASDG